MSRNFLDGWSTATVAADSEGASLLPFGDGRQIVFESDGRAASSWVVEQFEGGTGNSA